MNSFQKFLRYLDTRKKKRIIEVIRLIKTMKLDSLDVKKMQGNKDTYRVRVGNIRIIFVVENEIGIPIEINTRGNVY